jgi:hypothetical protein
MTLGTCPFSVLKIPKDHNATLGANCAIVLLSLDGEHAHGWDSFGSIGGVLAMRGGKDIHRFHAFKAIAFFTVGVEPCLVIGKLRIHGIAKSHGILLVKRCG